MAPTACINRCYTSWNIIPEKLFSCVWWLKEIVVPQVHIQSTQTLRLTGCMTCAAMGPLSCTKFSFTAYVLYTRRLFPSLIDHLSLLNEYTDWSFFSYNFLRPLEKSSHLDINILLSTLFLRTKREEHIHSTVQIIRLKRDRITVG
jgi:hypothetical protein